MDAEIEKVEQDLKNVLADEALSDEERKLSGAVFTEHVAALHRKRFRDSRKTAEVQNHLEGEVISKYWSMINKPKKPKDIIDRLLKDTSALDPADYSYESNSKKMATMARNYHSKIQNDRREMAPDIRHHTIEVVLSRTARKANNDQVIDLSKKLMREDVQEALKLSANGKAPGLNGFTYEFWKILDDRYRTAVRLEKEGFDIIKVLLLVFNDIETNGMVAGTNFSESWMCPLCKKKKNRADIANHRPISLLNSDYKIFTKALTIKLARAAPDLIHPNQAGFVPGRHIYDQIWLTKRVIELVEATESDSLIVALDQEKAYDKIEHDYLWKALRSFNIPEQFINTVKSLYSDAFTYVMINREKSALPFRVT
jgi:hypothetical protein